MVVIMSHLRFDVISPRRTVVALDHFHDSVKELEVFTVNLPGLGQFSHCLCPGLRPVFGLLQGLLGRPLDTGPPCGSSVRFLLLDHSPGTASTARTVTSGKSDSTESSCQNSPVMSVYLWCSAILLNPGTMAGTPDTDLATCGEGGVALRQTVKLGKTLLSLQ